MHYCENCPKPIKQFCSVLLILLSRVVFLLFSRCMCLFSLSLSFASLVNARATGAAKVLLSPYDSFIVLSDLDPAL